MLEGDEALLCSIACTVRKAIEDKMASSGNDKIPPVVEALSGSIG